MSAAHPSSQWLAPVGALGTALALFGCSENASSASELTSSTSETACATIAAEIARQTKTDGTCTAVVRLDYQSLKILGHAYVCGKVAPLDEATARDVATQHFSQFSLGGIPVQLLSGTATSDEWVFTSEAGDFGHALALSTRSGLSVFDGELSFNHFQATAESGDRGGSLSLGSSESKTDLGEGCPAVTAPSVRTFDLRSDATGAPPQPEQAVNAVMATALPDGLGRWASVLDAVVLVTGGFEPETPIDWHAEYVVLLNAGTG